MSKSHTWFATKNDAKLVISWLRNAGARQITGEPLEGEWEPDGRELGLHFSDLGPLQFWPNEIRLEDYEESNPRWKRAVLAKIEQQEKPGQPQIDCDKSPVAGLKLPGFRDGRYWVAGHVWFPTSRVNDVFPELERICQRFERFLNRYPTVFDNRKGEDKCGFGYQLCAGGLVHRIVALPEAEALLRRGGFMVDYLTSPKTYSEFRRRLQLAGYER